MPFCLNLQGRNVDTLAVTRARTVPKVPADEAQKGTAGSCSCQESGFFGTALFLFPRSKAKIKNMGDLMTLGSQELLYPSCNTVAASYACWSYLRSHWYKTRLDHRQNSGNKTLGMKAAGHLTPLNFLQRFA